MVETATIELMTSSSKISDIFKTLSDYEGFDDFILYELQDKLKMIYDWDDSFFVYFLKLNGIEETTESIALSHPDQLFRLGQVIEERTQDLCEHNLEILLSAISCYEKAAPYLLVLHQLNQSETQKELKP
jgi:hypothetical protein